MPNPASTPHPELLLAQASWVRRLARTLVADAHLAEDLTQDTFVRALEHPPRADQPLRGWLATVMRNLAAQGRRGEGRRSAREARAARPEPGDASDDVVARVATQRGVVEAVLALDEPYRTTLLLRYFEELPPRRIAARQGVPVSTVKTRLARGIAALRQRLDESHGGDGKAWLGALLPLTRWPEGAWAPSLSTVSFGVLAVNAKVLAVCLLLALAGTIAVVATRGDDPAAATGVTAAGVEAAAPIEPELATPERRTAGEARVLDATRRAPVEPATTPAYAASPAPAEASALRGRVIDVDSVPVAGVAVGFGPGAASGATARSGAGGAFSLPAGDATGHLYVDDEHWTTVLAGARVPRSSGKEAVVVVAPPLLLGGAVVDAASGLAIDGAHVRVELPRDFRADFALDLDHSIDVPRSTRTDASGRFAFVQAPRVPSARLTCAAEGFLAYDEPLPLVADDRLVIALERPALQGTLLTGRVVAPGGAPVPDAKVSLGIDVRTTDERGEFSFDLAAPRSFNRAFGEMLELHAGTRPATPGSLLAVASGRLPATYEAPRNPDGEPVWPEFVTLVLGDEPRSIAGTVVDVDGGPVAGARVWLNDPTFFGGIGDAASGERPDMIHVETLLRGEGDRFWNFVETDERGEFRLEGLLDRDYTVEAMVPDTLLRAVIPAVPAGRSNLVVALPEEEVYPELRGTVVGADGEPIPDVRVFPMCDAFRMRVAGTIVGTRHARAGGTTTDAEGRFKLERVPRNLVYLRLDGAETLPLEWGRHVEGGLGELVGDDFEDLVITVARRCHFQVELDDPAEADRFAMLDARGDELEISEFVGNGRGEGFRQSLLEGRSNPMAAPDTAATIVLYLGNEEVRRAPIRLAPGERVTIRP